jgi:hypothetical protein
MNHTAGLWGYVKIGREEELGDGNAGREWHK